MAGCALPEDWQPTNHDREYAHQKLHLTDLQVDEMAEDMRLWAGANKNRAVARKDNWSMAFKGWMRRVSKREGRQQNGTIDRSASAAAGRLADELRAGTVRVPPKTGSAFYTRPTVRTGRNS